MPLKEPICIFIVGHIKNDVVPMKLPSPHAKPYPKQNHTIEPRQASIMFLKIIFRTFFLTRIPLQGVQTLAA
eukprot:TRINITY_DN9936_c0_g1_i1.p2 TRINITY_DN9936_c0_g1~~TRINITY_DN9936_c0_g1_i1.p2  ORF type:complete len:72 (+),score=2.15 TRINITY_DN9936_c0_g1_i1:75-290(+)